MTPKQTGRKSPIEHEIEALFEADQAERLVGYDNIDFDAMRKNDAVRLARAREIHHQWHRGEVGLSGESLYQLAMLFQHSPETIDYMTAKALAEEAAAVGHAPGRWLSAAAEDRYLLATGKPQIWGTQFKQNEAGEWELANLADDTVSGLTDQARKQRGIPKRQDLLSEFLKRDDL